MLHTLHSIQQSFPFSANKTSFQLSKEKLKSHSSNSLQRVLCVPILGACCLADFNVYVSDIFFRVHIRSKLRSSISAGAYPGIDRAERCDLNSFSLFSSLKDR